MTEKLSSIKVVVSTIIVNNKKEILLTKSLKWKDKWLFCGGHVNPGEKILEAAKREVKEETGLDTKPIKIISFHEVINPKDFKRKVHFLAFSCLLVTKKTDIKLQETELVDYLWVKPEKAVKMKLTEIHLKLLDEYIKSLKRV